MCFFFIKLISSSTSSLYLAGTFFLFKNHCLNGFWGSPYMPRVSGYLKTLVTSRNGSFTITCTTMFATDCFGNEPRHDKTNKMAVRPAKTRISLGIRPLWSESSLSAWWKLGSLATHWAQAKTLIRLGGCWALTHFVGFVMSCLKFWSTFQIRDGLTPKVHHCGTELLPDFISDTRIAIVEFKSDASIRKKGFKAAYSLIEGRLIIRPMLTWLLTK